MAYYSAMKKKWGTDTCYGMDKLWKHYANERSQTLKPLFWWFPRPSSDLMVPRQAHRNQMLLCLWLWFTTAKGCCLKAEGKNACEEVWKKLGVSFQVYCLDEVTQNALNSPSNDRCQQVPSVVNQGRWHEPWYPGFFLGVSHTNYSHSATHLLAFSYSDCRPAEQKIGVPIHHIVKMKYTGKLIQHGPRPSAYKNGYQVECFGGSELRIQELAKGQFWK